MHIDTKCIHAGGYPDSAIECHWGHNTKFSRSFFSFRARDRGHPAILILKKFFPQEEN